MPTEPKPDTSTPFVNTPSTTPGDAKNVPPNAAANAYDDKVRETVARTRNESAKNREMVDADRQRYLGELGKDSGTSPYGRGGPRAPITPEEAGGRIRGEK